MDKRLGCFMRWHGESELYLEATWVQRFKSETGWSGQSCRWTELFFGGRWTGMCRANMPIRRGLSRDLISSYASDPIKGRLVAVLRARMLLRHSVQPTRPRLFLMAGPFGRDRALKHCKNLQNCKTIYTTLHNYYTSIPRLRARTLLPSGKLT